MCLSIHPSIHLSICLSTPGGGYPSQVQAGGTPARSSWGYPCQGVPHLRYPPSDLAGGYPSRGDSPPQVPHQTWLGGTLVGVPHLGYHQSDLARGYPVGVPHLRYPPIRPTWGYPGRGVTPLQVPPSQTLPGGPHWGYPTLSTPPVGPGWGVGTSVGVPHLRYPPSDLAKGYPRRGTLPRIPHSCQTWLGGTLTGGYPTSYRITDGVLDMLRSACLLHSRRRTFLFLHFSNSVYSVHSRFSKYGETLYVHIYINTNIVSTILYSTRKSCSMTARGIPPAVQQVLALLFCLGGGGGTQVLSWPRRQCNRVLS